jgi:hypothetical protein
LESLFESEQTSLSAPSTSNNQRFIQDNESIDSSISVKIPQAIDSTKLCVICKSSDNLINIPNEAYLDTFISSNILIPSGGKCCQKHLNRKITFHKKDLNNIEIVSNETFLKDYEVQLMFDSLRHLAKTTTIEKFSHITAITENDCLSYTGNRYLFLL